MLSRISQNCTTRQKFWFSKKLGFSPLCNKAAAVRELSTVAILSQITVVLVSLPCGFYGKTAETQKRLVFWGIMAMACLFAMLMVLPHFVHEASALHLCVQIGGIVYGAGSGLVAVGDMALALKLLPVSVGNGAAMSLFGPSITWGFVVGSVLTGSMRWDQRW